MDLFFISLYFYIPSTPLLLMYAADVGILEAPSSGQNLTSTRSWAFFRSFGLYRNFEIKVES